VGKCHAFGLFSYLVVSGSGCYASFYSHYLLLSGSTEICDWRLAIIDELAIGNDAIVVVLQTANCKFFVN
jgi:hypothetical protein